MKRTINKWEFRDAFRDMGRKDQFSYNGLGALFERLEGYEEDTGEEIELDVIALCCDYSEYDTALEAAREHGYEPEAHVLMGGEMDEQEAAALKWLQERRTTVITFDGGVII